MGAGPGVIKAGARRRVVLGVAMASLCVFGGSQPASAGPWVKAPGEGYVKLAAGTFRGDDIFTLGGSRRSIDRTYQSLSLQTYAEVGVAERVAVAVSTQLIQGSNVFADQTVSKLGMGDLDVTAQVQLIKHPRCPLAAHLTARLPLYSGVVEDGDAPGSAGGDAPALGDGSVDLTPTLAFGCSLHPVPGWFTLEAGPQLRLRGFGDGVRYAADLGVFVWPERVALAARVEGQERFSQDNDRPTKRYVSFGGAVLVRVARGFAVEASANMLPTGAFVSRGWGASLGVSYTGRLFGRAEE